MRPASLWHVSPLTCLLQVRVLVEEGRANVAVQDRWGNTPLDEARRVGAALVVTYLEQALVKRREAEVAARAEQQRLLGGASSASSASAVSNWRREQQLQQQLRSAEVTELYRLRQVQAQQVRRLSSSILGESRQPQEPGAATTAPAAAAPPSVGAGTDAAARAGAGTKPGQAGSTAAVGELLQLAAQAQQALTLKVEEMELDLVENLQHKKEQLQQQEQPSNSNGNSGSRRSANGSSSGSSRSNNVVSASKLQQPASQPVQAQPSVQATPKLQQ